MTPPLPGADGQSTGHSMGAILAAWEQSLGVPGTQALRLLGFFSGPVAPESLRVLRRPPPILGITDELAELNDKEWNAIIDHLVRSSLVWVECDEGGERKLHAPIDCHDLTREYLRARLLEAPAESLRAAHLRLYQHLSAVQDRPQPALPDLLPLYAAVFHGCKAGHPYARSAYEDIYLRRINGATTESPSYYAADTLGAYGTDLAGLSNFVEHRWDRFVEGIDDDAKVKLLVHAADLLEFLGRVDEARPPLESALTLLNSQREKDWRAMAKVAYRGAMQAWRAGRIAEAVGAAKEAVEFAVKTADVETDAISRSCYGFALLLAGKHSEALKALPDRLPPSTSEKEKWLHNYRSFEIRMAVAERASWLLFLGATPAVKDFGAPEAAVKAERERFRQMVAPPEGSTTAYGLYHLLCGRLALYAAQCGGGAGAETETREAREHIRVAIETVGAQALGAKPVCLESRAWLRVLEGDCDAAREDLNELFALARTGSMGAHQIEAHLYRARLFLRVYPYPWQGRDPSADLAEARQLIEKSGYLRRMEELRDAEKLLHA